MKISMENFMENVNGKHFLGVGESTGKENTG